MTLVFCQKVFIVLLQVFKLINDKLNQAVFIRRHIHEIEVIPQKIFDRLHSCRRYHLSLGNLRLPDLALFPEHVRKLRIIRLHRGTGILNRHLLPYNQQSHDSRNIDLTPSIRNRLVSFLNIRHGSR